MYAFFCSVIGSLFLSGCPVNKGLSPNPNPSPELIFTDWPDQRLVSSSACTHTSYTCTYMKELMSSKHWSNMWRLGTMRSPACPHTRYRQEWLQEFSTPHTINVTYLDDDYIKQPIRLDEGGSDNGWVSACHLYTHTCQVTSIKHIQKHVMWQRHGKECGLQLWLELRPDKCHVRQH